MPQASEALRKRWGGTGGVGEDKAVVFLEKRGWTLSRKWTWSRKDGRTRPTRREWGAMLFLIHEWDYGGIE